VCKFLRGVESKGDQGIERERGREREMKRERERDEERQISSFSTAAPSLLSAFNITITHTHTERES
jgi:hypothetical protein